MKKGVQVIVTNEKKLLLMQRKNTGYFDGSYGLPGGRVEEKETTTEAAVRETLEEIGLTIHELQSVFSVLDDEWEHDFFRVQAWKGVPTNLEPHKCSTIQWYQLQSIPKNITPQVQCAIDYLLQHG